MPGDPNQRDSGFRGGPRGSTGRGRGPYRGRGRGRGGKGGGGRGRRGYHTLNDMGEVLLMAENNQYSAGTASPRGRGSGQISNPGSGSNTPRGRGRRGITDSSFLGGRGRGIGEQSPNGRGHAYRGRKLQPNAPLSRLLYQERPLLRPVIFVPSVYSRKLFQEEEEIFQPIVEDVGEDEQSHVPTADRVFRVFSGNIPQVMPSSSDNELETMDFNETEKLLETPLRPLKADVQVIEEKFSGIFLDTSTAPVPSCISSRPSTPPMLVDDSTPTNADMITPSTPADALKSDIEASMTNGNAVAVDGERVDMLRNEHGVTMDTRGESVSLSTEDPSSQATTTEESYTGFYIDTEPSPIDTDAEGGHPQLSEVAALVAESTGLSIDDKTLPVHTAHEHTQLPEATAPFEGFTGFYIDTEPSTVDTHRGAYHRVRQDEDDEIIVYVAPHPRAGRATPAPSEAAPTWAPSLPSTSILTGTTALPSTSDLATAASTAETTSTTTSTTPIPPAPSFKTVDFAFTPTPKKPRVYTIRSKTKAGLRQRRQEAHAVRRRAERQVLFGSFGAMMSEAQLRGGRRDPRRDERRRGDSDVDWGESDEAEGGDAGAVTGVDVGLGLAEGMELDPELEGDQEAMRRFVKGMGRDGAGGSFVTMDDIADGEMMRMEDKEDVKVLESSGEDEEDETAEDEAEVDAVVHAAEKVLIAEPEDAELVENERSDEDVSDDDEDSPRRSFQARLERLRSQTRGHGKASAKQVAFEDRESDDEHMSLERSWADQDEDFIEEIQMMLDENEHILTGRDRKARNKLFRAVHNGAFEDLEDFKPARKSKDKYKDLPPELQQQWQKDREKKAEHKRLRAQVRLELAADPMAQHKGGKKGRKAMLAAAKLDPTITVLPNRIIDMTTLVQQIRRFLADIGGPKTMSLPPTDKATRKNIHEMAQAFNLKSLSKGKGDARYATLTKTTRSGLPVDEKKVAKIMRRFGGGGGRGEFMGSNVKGSNGGKPVLPKHKEGEEVGKAAPKIGGSNIGFRMLELMGWSEGQRIGVTGGLDAPLTAVIKNTRLGLGATR